MPHVDPALNASERDRILMEQLPQVRFIAKRIHERLPQQVELDDLISAGYIGLLDAIRKYDATKNVQFKSYAQFRVRGAILDSLRELDWSPRELRRKARQIEEVNRKLTVERGHSPCEQEIANELGMELLDYHALLSDLHGLDLGSIHAFRGHGDEGDQDVCHYIPDPGEDPLFKCLRSEMAALLTEGIADLPPRERQIMALYYVEELNMREIAQVMGVVESRISQMHTSAILKLRSRLAGARDREVKPGSGTAKVLPFDARRQPAESKHACRVPKVF